MASNSQDINTNAPSFKGVVYTPSGYWGAQIYVNQHRIWLGTFKDKIEAAKAYDSASMKIRRWDLNRNIPKTTDHEPSFQRQFNEETVINMIKDGSYRFKFLAYMEEQSVNMLSPAKNEELYGNKLFHKELTHSDVSNSYNRLVIPKNFAKKHFWENNNAFDKEIICYDKFGAQWKFRLCYWKSSDSFVFTCGWRTFLKDKKLRAKDRIVFYSRNHKSNSNEVTPTFVIDLEYYNCFQLSDVLEKERHLIQATEQEDYVPDALEEEKDLMHRESSGSTSQGVMLFGVRIA